MATRVSKRLRRRAKQVRSQATVDAILEAAARILMRYDYASSTTNRIADRAGVSVGTLYQYFGDKNEIFDALILRERQRILGIIEREPFDANEPLQDGLERFFRIIFRSMPLGPELFRRLEHVPDALLRRRVSEIKKYVIALVRAQLEVHRAEIRVDDLDLAAFLIVNACEGIGINASGELWNERLTDELASLFARYLRGG